MNAAIAHTTYLNSETCLTICHILYTKVMFELISIRLGIWNYIFFILHSAEWLVVFS